MLRNAKILARRYLPRPVFEGLKYLHRRHVVNSPGPFSDEEPTILKWLQVLGATEGYFVDIAAQDGIGGSQTLQLAKRKWRGAAFECDGYYFAALSYFYSGFSAVDLIKARVSPDNVTSLLAGCECPRNFDFLSLDIDSFDYQVLDSILAAYRPKLICCEINEVIPPPLGFRVLYSKDHQWEGGVFQGQSISMCARLVRKYRYVIAELYYNNLLLVPAELMRGPGLDVVHAYRTGYLQKPDRLEKFPWNKDYEFLYNLPPGEVLAYFRKAFEKREGKFELTMES